MGGGVDRNHRQSIRLMPSKRHLVPVRNWLELGFLTKPLLASLVLLFVGNMANAQSFLEPMGPVAAEQKSHFIHVFFTVLIAIVPVLVGTPLIALRYRRGGKGKYRPDFAASRPLEYLFWGVPITLTLLLAYWLISSVNRLDPYKPLGDNPLQIQVIGLDWKWLFIYPEQNMASVGTLALPAGRPVQLQMTTDTVMQSLLIPKLAGQIYAMPGMVTKLNILAEEPGQTNGFNSQYNGEKFTQQIVDVQILDETDFEAWIQGASSAPQLDQSSYALLGVPGVLTDAQEALGMSDTRLKLGDAQLFQAVVERYIGGQAIDATAQPGSPSYKMEDAQ